MKVNNLVLLGHQKVTGKIVLETGLRIGGGGETIEIGGLDNPVIKHPITRVPDIPGSSLKGKMRSLLELKLNKIEPGGEVHRYKEDCELSCPICRIFGVSAGAGSPFGPGRLVIRDCRLTSLQGETDLTKTEIKWENVINRIFGTATPRQMERVPAGAEFSFKMDYRIFSVVTEDGKEDEGEVDKKLFDYVLQGLKLVQMDTLGGSGSRGYGKVRFQDVEITDLDGKKKSVNIDDVQFKEIKP